jgi:hypothetical protein
MEDSGYHCILTATDSQKFKAHKKGVTDVRRGILTFPLFPPSWALAANVMA